ncbi:MAG TPA: hypothetical protein VF266_26015 [Thermoanaerobaculia bacterium]
MTKRIAAVLALVITLPLHADFASVARAIDSQHGVKRIWIPFLGLARFVVRVVAPEGVHDFQLATFEGADNLDPKKLGDIIRTQAGPGFSPLVQVWSRRSNDWSFIYARPSKRADRLELLILAHDKADTVLVRVDVDADMIARELKDRPRHVSNVARR